MGRKKKHRKRRTSLTHQHTRDLHQRHRPAIDAIRQTIGEDAVVAVSYDITNEPLQPAWYQRLPTHVKERIEALHGMLLTDPEHVITEASELLKHDPNIPTLYNYLGIAYAQTDDMMRREAVIMECYTTFPNYLFGRVNYAQLCLEKRQPDNIPEIFDGKLDLKLLYPQRTTFHLSEYVGFAGIIAWYYALIGERHAAKLYYKTLKQFAPHDPITRIVKRILYPPLRVRLYLWLYKKATGRDFLQEEEPDTRYIPRSDLRTEDISGHKQT